MKGAWTLVRGCPATFLPEGWIAAGEQWLAANLGAMLRSHRLGLLLAALASVATGDTAIATAAVSDGGRLEMRFTEDVEPARMEPGDPSPIGDGAFGTTDIDGDGLHDVLTHELRWGDGDEPTQLRYHGLSGLTGEDRWFAIIEAPDAAWVGTWLAADFDGDGARDVIAHWLQEPARGDRTCVVTTLLCLPADPPSSSVIAAWHMTVLSGRDGSPIRKIVIEQPAGSGAGTFRVDEASPSVIGDLTGDDLPEFVITITRTTIEESLPGNVLAPSSVEYESHAQIVSIGEDRTWTTEKRSELGPPRILAAGNAVGDARDDLFWEESWVDPARSTLLCQRLPVCSFSDPDHRYRITMIDGASGEHAWSISSPNHGSDIGSWGELDLDVDADGFRDLVLFLDGDLTTLSGATGELLWAVPPTPSILGGQLVGDANGDGIDDLAFIDSVDYEAVTVHYLSGASGALLHRRTFPEGDPAGRDVAAGLVGDLDADGVIDFAGYVAGDGLDPTFQIFSGSNGSILIDLRGAAVPDGVEVTGDVHPAGADEILFLWAHPDGVVGRELWNLASGLLWSGEDPYGPGSLRVMAAGGDVDGVPGPDLFFDGASSSSLDLVSSADGVRRWRLTR